MRELGDKISSAILLVHGVHYNNQKSIGLYPTTGSADDWFYSDDANEGNGEFRSAAYTIELRDTGSYGFILPPAQVRMCRIYGPSVPHYNLNPILHSLRKLTLIRISIGYSDK